MNMYRMRYRARLVEDAFVKARDLSTALEVAKVWCNSKGYKFISCRDPVVADESILGRVERERRDLSQIVMGLSVKEVMDKVQSGEWDVRDVLQAERSVHDRKSLVEFCLRTIEAGEAGQGQAVAHGVAV